MRCFYCNKEFKPKQLNLQEPENHIHAVCQVFGTMMHDNVCDDRVCQKRKEYECDQFDAYRKGE